ncbi:type II toxin-antitoxin system VapB family antitoxin [Pseudomonas sp. 3A(2025)]
MRIVSIFKNGSNPAIRLPADMTYDTITLRPARPGWLSLARHVKADADFLLERPGVVSDEDRFNL